MMMTVREIKVRGRVEGEEESEKRKEGSKRREMMMKKSRNGWQRSRMRRVWR